jgi:hypothetical protein
MNQLTMALIPWGAFRLVARYGAHSRAETQEQHEEEAPAKKGTMKDEMKQKMKEKMKDMKCCPKEEQKEPKS